MKNHQIVNGKLLQMNKTFDHLKERQRVQISEWLYEAYKGIRTERNRVPNREDDVQIIEAVMQKISDAEIWIPGHEVEMSYKSKKIKFSQLYLYGKDNYLK